MHTYRDGPRSDLVLGIWNFAGAWSLALGVSLLDLAFLDLVLAVRYGGRS